ncbi:MAG: Holliday junction branch migration protein RuvA [Bacilli bacterium]|nr:Holliday junction branch migration protein RuvA [Bacilli bacterium]
MYDYIEGTITDIKSNFITLDNRGIGYKIATPNPYVFKPGETYKIFIYQHIREEEMSLYGFKTNEEKDLFLRLIEVKGVGPKTTLPMLATGSVSGIIDAIERENLLYLRKFPKIGEKVAKQIILDLKGKLVSSDLNIIDQTSDELIEVLKGLGYKTQDINKIIPKINLNNSIEEQIKESLKLFLK